MGKVGGLVWARGKVPPEGSLSESVVQPHPFPLCPPQRRLSEPPFSALGTANASDPPPASHLVPERRLHSRWAGGRPASSSPKTSFPAPVSHMLANTPSHICPPYSPKWLKPRSWVGTLPAREQNRKWPACTHRCSSVQRGSKFARRKEAINPRIRITAAKTTNENFEETFKIIDMAIARGVQSDGHPPSPPARSDSIFQK